MSAGDSPERPIQKTLEGTAAVALPPVRLRSGTPRCHVLRQEAERGSASAAERLVGESRWRGLRRRARARHVPATSAPDLALRLLHCEAWARMYLGEIDSADALCERARALAEGPLRRHRPCRGAVPARRRPAEGVADRERGIAVQRGAAPRRGRRPSRDRVRARAFEWRCPLLRDAARLGCRAVRRASTRSSSRSS